MKTHVEIEGGWPEWFHVCGECHGILSSSKDKEVCPYCKSELDWSDMYVNLDWSRQTKNRKPNTDISRRQNKCMSPNIFIRRTSMRLTDLLENKEFEFNVPYRIVNYTPTEKDPDHVTVLYESNSEDPWPTHLMDKWISAINQDEKTGIIDIECY